MKQNKFKKDAWTIQQFTSVQLVSLFDDNILALCRMQNRPSPRYERSGKVLTAYRIKTCGLINRNINK